MDLLEFRTASHHDPTLRCNHLYVFCHCFPPSIPYRWRHSMKNLSGNHGLQLLSNDDSPRCSHPVVATSWTKMIGESIWVWSIVCRCQWCATACFWCLNNRDHFHVRTSRIAGLDHRPMRCRSPETSAVENVVSGGTGHRHIPYCCHLLVTGHDIHFRLLNNSVFIVSMGIGTVDVLADIRASASNANGCQVNVKGWSVRVSQLKSIAHFFFKDTVSFLRLFAFPFLFLFSPFDVSTVYSLIISYE